MANAVRDDNRIPSFLGVSSLDLVTPTQIFANPTTHAMFIDGASLYTAVQTKMFLTVGTSNADYVTNGTNDRNQIQAAINAVNTAGGGTVYIKAGTYNITGASITSPNTTNVINLIGDGIDSTILKAGDSRGEVIQLSSNGKIQDMTIDGNGKTTQGLVFIVPVAGVTVDRIDFRRLKIRNIDAAQDGWVFIVWDQTSTYAITEMYCEDVVVEGPASNTHDAFAITFVDTAYFTNFTIRDVYRSPNFYQANRVFIDGMYITNVPAFLSLVIDGGVGSCFMNNVRVDANCGEVWLLAPQIRATNCEFLTDTYFGTGGGVGGGELYMSNSKMASLVIGSLPGIGFFDNCKFVPTGHPVATVADNLGPGNTIENLYFNHCYFDNTNSVNGRWLASFDGNTWDNMQFNDCILTGGSAIYNITEGPNFVTGNAANGFTTTVGDMGNKIALTVNQNDVTNNPNAVVVNNTAHGKGVDIEQTGNNGVALYINQTDTTNNVRALEIHSASPSVNGDEIIKLVVAPIVGSGLVLDNTGATVGFTDRATALFVTDNAAASVDTVTAKNLGTGKGLLIDQQGNGVAAYIKNTGTQNSLQVEGTTTTDLVIQKGGNTGIGRVPHAKLEVDGNIILKGAAGGNSWTNQRLLYGGDGTGYIMTIGSIKNDDTINTPVLSIVDNGLVGVGVTSPSAALHLKAGTATANTAPLKFTSGTNLTSAEAGAVEWDGTNLFISQTSGPTRKTIAYTSDISTQAGKITTYNNVATAGWGIPAIYGQGRSTAQTAAVTSVATYTVGAADGSFIISANCNITAFTAGTFNVTVTYTDETNTSQTLKLNFSSVTGTLGIALAAAGPFEGIPAHIRCKASTAITIATSGTFTLLTYNVEGYITQIG